MKAIIAIVVVLSIGGCPAPSLVGKEKVEVVHIECTNGWGTISGEFVVGNYVDIDYECGKEGCTIFHKPGGERAVLFTSNHTCWAQRAYHYREKTYEMGSGRQGVNGNNYR